MLTIKEGLQIAQESARRVQKTPVPEVNVQNVTLENYGLDSPSDFELLRLHIDSLVRQRAHIIDASNLMLVNRSSRIADLAQLICRFSLPGDEGFEEPLDPPTPGGDEGFDEP
ncbi:MAG TPA: hypothetical protein VJR02_00195 [Pyrinomonadaceae bacterium]|nr:hypothetical protein [Pyrinomonadaceae bacterium]